MCPESQDPQQCPMGFLKGLETNLKELRNHLACNSARRMTACVKLFHLKRKFCHREANFDPDFTWNPNTKGETSKEKQTLRWPMFLGMLFI